MKKKLCMLMALLMICLSAAACAETIELKVWSSQPDQALLEELCNAFAAEHPENEWKFTYGVVGEADAQARYLEDPAGIRSSPKTPPEPSTPPPTTACCTATP